MNTFLSHLANQITQNQSVAFTDTLIVLPNKRAKRVLLNILAEKIGKPFFAPEMTDVNQFIESLSTKTKLENTDLLIKLFSIYQKLTDRKSVV